MLEDLTRLTAIEALHLFRSGELSPVALVDSALERIERMDGRLNAITETLPDTARSAAREAERRYASGAARPLEGLPVAVKEEQPIAGRTWTEGSMTLKDRVADMNHPIVDRIVAAGGIVHARTTTPEFCAAVFTHSDLWGVSRNPWNPEYSPGGSSGGSGAALAAGMAPLATGSDIAGSIRVPASFNGVVGLKSPYGRVPGLPPINLDPYCVDGPMARTVADCALLNSVIAGQHPADLATVPGTVDHHVEPDVAGRRIALSLTLGDYPVEPEVRAAIHDRGVRLRDAGAVVEEVELNWRREEIMAAAWAHYGSIFSALITAGSADLNAMTPYVRDLVDRSTRAFASAGVLPSLTVESRIRSDLARLFTSFDALICPTSAVPAFRAGDDYLPDGIVVDGVALPHTWDSLLTIPFNMAGQCPVLAVPAGRAGNGIPIGAQIVGPPFAEATVFGIGAAIEAQGVWYRPDGWWPELAETAADR